MEVHLTYTYGDSTRKSTRHCLKKGGGERQEREIHGGGELIQSSMYTCRELS
jgi:hypothetical protein